MTVARGIREVGVGSAVARLTGHRPRRRHQLASDRPERRNDANMPPCSELAHLTQNESRRSKKER
jgi:hypothetical protein